MAPLASAVLAAAVVWLIYRALQMPVAPQSFTEQSSSLRDCYDRCAQSLADLDHDHATGKLPLSDYSTLRLTLQSELQRLAAAKQESRRA